MTKAITLTHRGSNVMYSVSGKGFGRKMTKLFILLLHGFFFSAVICSELDIHAAPPTCMINKTRFFPVFSVYPHGPQGVYKRQLHRYSQLFFFFWAKSSYEFHLPINWPRWVFTLIPGEWDIVGYCGSWPDLQ